MMKKILFSVFILGSLLACQSQTTTPQYGVLSASDFKSRIEEDNALILLDVRTPGEFAGGSIDGARNIDFQSPDFANQIKQLDKNATYGVYCAVGKRSAAAVQQMQDLGFTKLYDLAGGFNAWKKQETK